MMKKFLCLLLMTLIVVSLPCTVSASAEKGLSIHFIDVGQADAAVILCDDEVLMIDGGNVADSSLIYSYLTNTLAIDHIDYMIGTHPHEDHIGGLAGALNACSVGTVYSPVDNYDSDAFNDFKRYAEAQVGSLTLPSVGDTFTIGSATAQFLSPAYPYDNTNDASIVVKIVYGDTSFLFAGDAEWEAEHDMVESGYDLSATLLKAGHHGSDSSSSYVFLREVMPQYAVISVGEGNSYGHPTEEALSRLRDVGATVYRTDLQGTIICHSDGDTLTFETEKNPVAGDATSVSETASMLLKRGDRGENVRQIQSRLISLGYLNDSADGIFGAKTEAALIAYQAAAGLPETGECDYNTYISLNSPSAPSAPAAAPTAVPTQEPREDNYGGSAPYIGNRNTGKFHRSSCSSVDQMNESNKVSLYSREEAISMGYDPCKRCNP